MITNIYDLLNTILAGGLLGILGQGIRVAIGLKKLSDTNVTKVENEKEDLNTSRLILSLFIGFVAGALFLIIKGIDKIDKTDFIFSVIAAGYSGADFIEGLFNTYISKMGTTENKPTTPTTATDSVAQSNVSTSSSFASNERNDEPTNNL